MARIIALFLLPWLVLPAAWAQVVTQEGDELLGIKPPPPGFVDVIGIPDIGKIPAGAFPPGGMTVVDWAIGAPGGLMSVRLRAPCEREQEARKLMLDPVVVTALVDEARKRDQSPDR